MGPLMEAASQRHMSVTFGDIIPDNVDGIFVAKLHGKTLAERDKRKLKWLQQLASAMADGKRIIVDYTDHLLGAPSEVRQYYTDLLSMRVEVTTTNHQLAGLIRKFNRDITHTHIIDDWVEHGPRPPKVDSGNKARILWFGHETNIASLAPVLQKWPSETRISEILICSSREGLRLLQQHGPPSQHLSKINFVAWSKSSLEKAAADCSCCLITADSKGIKQFASSNRLVTALNLGLPTVAPVLPSYVDFCGHFQTLTVENLKALLQYPNDFVSGVESFQQKHSSRFSIAEIKRQWLYLLEGQLGSQET